MNWEYYVEKIWYKILYLLGVIFYLIKLNNLNQKLLLKNIDDSLDIIQYDNYAALKFFGVAFILILIGIGILCKEFSDLKIGRDWDAGLEDLHDIAISIITILVVIILMLLILDFIMVPILRAILTCAGVLIGIGYIATH